MNWQRIKGLCLASVLLMSDAAASAQPNAWLPIGGDNLTGWSGLTIAKGVGTLPASGDAVFRYPQGTRGWYITGFRTKNDGTCDWRAYFGLQLEVRTADGKAARLQADLLTPKAALRQEYLPRLHATIAVPASSGDAWQRMTIPWNAFDLNPSQQATLQFIQEVDLSCPGLQVRDIRLTRAPAIALEADVRGNAVSAGGTAHYDVTVTNCTDSPQAVTLGFVNAGWLSMSATVTPPQVTLAPGESAPCVVAVQVPSDGVPPGGHETQMLLATPTTAASAALSLVTARDVEGPTLLHTTAEWDAVRDNVAHYDWAKAAQDEIVTSADKWKVPPASLPPNNYSEAEKHVYVFANDNFPLVQTAAEAWQLTRDKKYAEKVATFMRELSDEKTGYPSTFAGTNMGGPQEGQNFQSVAIAYDAIRDAGVLNDADRKQVERTFRLYFESSEPNLAVGNVGNWSTAATTACLMGALSIGDLAAADRYINGPCGFTDYLSKGVMDDGWWWECSSGYNFWVASELTQCALACRPWGIDLLNLQVPASYSPDTIITPWGMTPPYGVSFEKWGPNRRATRSIKQLWDAVPAASDYRGVTFGLNDGHGERVGGSRLELAYYAYRDPAYATFIKLANKRDLVYGVPELPDDSAKPYTKSGFAENIGYALLRSQTPNRPIREQIEAVLKIGSQGGFHGHFDRVSLDNITRYGRSFWYPEAIWWGYPNFMYKFFVQTSVNSNMVVVDQKMQEAVPSTQPLFFSGKMMQVALQETNARWSDPPYLGMQYFPGDKPSDQMRKNMQSIPLATDRNYGELGPYTERILQRRMAIVTDDYVVIADYLKSDQPHTFDNLFQMKGLVSLDAANKQLLRHDAQWNADPHSSAQFVTDCDWYSASAPAVGRFHIDYIKGKPDRDLDADLNEPGVLNLDVRSLWPATQQLMLATPPENANTAQWVTYAVAGDGKSLAQGESGMWILGAASVDVPTSGVKQLALEVLARGSKQKSLFWTNARFITADGKELPVTGVDDSSNIDAPPAAGQDYYGGPVKITGVSAINPLATQPMDAASPAVLHVSVPAGAVRFKATLGDDYPLGDESQRRKIFASRVEGTEAAFITIIEPYESKPTVKSAAATGPDVLQVELSDGRKQEIHIRNLSGDAGKISVDLHETKDGSAPHDEHAGDERLSHE